jgi:hypothetical protein
MMLACVCGGVFETLFFALAGMLAWAAMILRRK